MVKRYFPVLLCFFAFTSAAQTPNPPPAAQAYGKIDKADLEMKSCEFEPDANAEVLFDKADIYFDPDFNIIMEFHRRVKIFNNNGKKWADIRLEYDGGNRNEYISDIQAESINLVDGKIEVTKVDKKLIYVQHIDRVRDAAVFSLPNVKEGSVIEYKYRWSTPSYANFPNWYFQDKIPVRYSELSTSIPDIFYYRTQTRTKDPYINHSLSYSAQSIGTGMRARSYNIQNELRALANIHSLPDENRYALLIDNNGGKLVKTPRSVDVDNQTNSEAHLILDANGGAKAQLKISSTGEYRALYLEIASLKTDEQKEAMIRMLNIKQPSAFEFKPAVDKDGMDEVNIELDYDKFCDVSAGSKQFYRPRVFDLWTVTVPVTEKRKTAYYFEHPMQKSCVTTIDLPAGFEVETLPKDQSLKFTYGNFEIKYLYNATKNQVISTSKFILTNQVIPAAKYNEMQVYMDGIAKAQNKKLVIHKKA
jgi:hypothetical protein